MCGFILERIHQSCLKKHYLLLGFISDKRIIQDDWTPWYTESDHRIVSITLGSVSAFIVVIMGVVGIIWDITWTTHKLVVQSLRKQWYFRETFRASLFLLASLGKIELSVPTICLVIKFIEQKWTLKKKNVPKLHYVPLWVKWYIYILVIVINHITPINALFIEIIVS